MKKPRPKMSAALAIAIENQVEDVIAAAKARCAINAHISNSRVITELKRADKADFIRDRAQPIRAFLERGDRLST